MIEFEVLLLKSHFNPIIYNNTVLHYWCCLADPFATAANGHYSTHLGRTHQRLQSGRGDHPQTAVNSIQGERAHTNMIYPFLLDTEEFLFVVQLVEEELRRGDNRT